MRRWSRYLRLSVEAIKDKPTPSIESIELIEPFEIQPRIRPLAPPLLSPDAASRRAAKYAIRIEEVGLHRIPADLKFEKGREQTMTDQYARTPSSSSSSLTSSSSSLSHSLFLCLSPPPSPAPLLKLSRGTHRDSFRALHPV